MTSLSLSADDVLTTTRSVRKRLDLSRPVPLELVKECLQIALQAPSGSNRQGWHWVVVTDADKRAAIAAFYRRSWSEYSSPGTSASRYPDDPDRTAIQTRVTDSASYLAEHLHEVPVMVIACIEAEGRMAAENQASLWGSVLPAAWSFQMAARSRGLGSAWTTLHLRYESEIAELLGIPDDVRQGVLLPTAYSLGTDFRPARRQPLDEVLHVDGW